MRMMALRRPSFIRQVKLHLWDDLLEADLQLMSRWARTLDASAIFSKNPSVSTASARQAFAAALVQQLREHGFARVRNHGIAPATIQQLFTIHREFFKLSLEDKLTVRHPGGEAPARGYSPWAYEKTSVLRPDLHGAPSVQSSGASDALSAGNGKLAAGTSATTSASYSSQLANMRDVSSTTGLQDAREQFAVGPPHDERYPTPVLEETLLPGFNAITHQAYGELQQACGQLVAAIEHGLGAPRDSIVTRTGGGGGAELNLNFYPEVDRTVLDPGSNKRRIWPHSDLGVVSALLQDRPGATGLELEVRPNVASSDPSPTPPTSPSAGTTFAPLPLEDAADIVLLVSDTLERWTNGYLRAGVHRVGVPPTVSGAGSSNGNVNVNGSSDGTTNIVPERMSAVMFYRAPPAASVGPLPHFVTAENPARFEEMTAETYLKSHNVKLY